MFLAVKQTVVLTEHYLLIGVGTTSAPTGCCRPSFPRLPALDLEILITMPGCAKTMRAMTKLERPAIAIMPSPWDKD